MADRPGVASMRRDLVGRIVHAVRSLGAAHSLDDALRRITDHVVELLDYSAAALNVLDAAGDTLVVRAVSGPAAAEVLLGERGSRADWELLISRSKPYGRLLFADHLTDVDPELDGVPSWSELTPAGAAPPNSPVDASGVWQSGDTLLAPIRDEHGELVGVLSADLAVGSVLDTEQMIALELFAAEAGSALLEWAAREQADVRRRTVEHRLRAVWDSGLIATAVIDEHRMVLDVNEAGATMLGWTREELVGRSIDLSVPEQNQAQSRASFELLLEGDSWVDERRLRHRDGHDVWVLMHAVSHPEGLPARPVVIVQWTDVTQRRAATELLARQLDYDALTDLPNRRHLEQRLPEVVATDGGFGVLACEIDGPGGVVDGLGRAAADALMMQVVERLAAACAPAELARVLSERLVVVVRDTDLEALQDLAATICEAFDRPFAVADVVIRVQVSVGVSARADRRGHALDVLREAEEALGRARHRGWGQVEVFDPLFDRPVTRADLELELDLRHDLERGRHLEPRFQSVISLETGELAGYEMLLRWRHSRLGVVLPDRFMPVAERAGLAADVGWQVLELAAVATPPGEPSERGWMSVNVAAAQLGRGRLIDAVRRLLDSETFAAHHSELHLEITETSLLEASPSVVDELYAVVELGARLALDDFGTGYSSLTMLRDLPVSVVKIDRSFISPIAVDIRARTIVQHTIQLCRGLGIATVGEGIETPEQLAWLQTLGCEYGQGFLIDRPTIWPSGVARLDEQDRGAPPHDVRRFGT